ncbi:hypothetical protein TNCV_3665831 [Trichonephila clavipes]|nr:hypothetical protein TNCV_3665831 [Trichonephila clavipes]
MVNAVMDTGAQMPVVRADVVEGQSVDSGGTIQIMSAFGNVKAVEGITADDPKSISSQEMTRETYPSEIYIQSVSKANAEEQLPEGKETRSTFIKTQREDDTLGIYLWREHRSGSTTTM